MPFPFAAAEVLTAANLNAMIGAPTQNNQTGTSYTLALLDAGKTVTLSNASAVSVTVPLQSTVAWAANTQINLLNIGAGLVTIAGAGGVTINGTPLTLATSKGGSLIRTASNTWTFVPLGSGVSNANFTDTATGTYTDGGINYKYLTLTSTGSVTFDRAGFADILVIGGGAGGGSFGGGGGAGGYLAVTNAYFEATAQTVVIGAGGAGATAASLVRGVNGSTSRCGNYYGVGGGAGGGQSASFEAGFFGGSGGGASQNAAGGAGTSGQGFAGGGAFTSGGNSAGGGGGGASAVGVTGVTGPIGGAGGAGTASTITGTSVTRGGGGGGGSRAGTAGAAGAGGGGAGTNNDTNGGAGTISTGGGGGGSGYASSGGAGGAGGSGIVIIRVVV